MRKQCTVQLNGAYELANTDALPKEGGMEAPIVSITVTGDEGTEIPSRTIRFQCGLLRETETFVEEDLEDVPREALLDYVVDMLNVKV